MDTSFWVAACHGEVAANCLDLFDITVPQAVESEIRSVQGGYPHREYPYATLFRHLREQMSDAPSPAPPPVPMFGPGEAEAIALAQRMRSVLLVNERRAARYAANLGVSVVTVPEVVIALCVREIISVRAARRKLDIIARITAREIIDDALRVLRTLEAIP